MKTVVRTEKLTKRFGDLTAVDAIDLEVREGEVFGFLGPNGAGKTTTLRLLCALIAPTSGTAEIAGFRLGRDDSKIRAAVGILTEQPGLYERQSAWQNLVFYATLYGLSATDARAQAERYLRLMGLWDRREEPVATFSRGMKQKMAIARAALHEPRILFLDEPTTGLDPDAAKTVREFIVQLRGVGRTVFLCTHNLDEADRLCDRIAFVRGGLLRVDTPAALRGSIGERGLSIRLGGPVTADQIGAVRAIDGVAGATTNDGLLRIGADDPEAIAPLAVRALVAAGGDIVEVRPERTSLEAIYFDVMGVSPGADGIEDIV